MNHVMLAISHYQNVGVFFCELRGLKKSIEMSFILGGHHHNAIELGMIHQISHSKFPNSIIFNKTGRRRLFIVKGSLTSPI